MTEKKQTIIEGALLDMKNIENALKANSKEILRSIMKEEIEGYMKGSMSEDEDEGYEEDEIELNGDDVATDELPMDAIGGGEEVAELPIGGEEEVEVDDELPIDLDMTNASDDDVIAVYKKLSGEDEIEVVSDNEVKITDPTSGNQYVVKLGGEGVGTEEPVGDDLGIDIDGGDDELEIEPEADVDGEEEIDIDIDSEDEDEDELGESVMYEIELQDDEDVTNEDIVRGKGHDKEVMSTTAPNTGDIEGQKAGKDSDSGDNLDGGFEDDQKFADDKGANIMSEEDEAEESEEPIEEKIQVGKARRVANVGTDIKGAGGKANNVVAPNVTANESIVAKYNALVKESNQLKKENTEFKEALKNFRNMLSETVVFNSNLAHVVKLFTEHTTTKEEKKQIIERFDDTVNSLKESKKLYKTIVSELSTKKPVTESVEAKINKDVTSSKAQITESTVYVDKSTERIKSLINRVEGR